MVYKKLKRVFWHQPRWAQLLILRTMRPKMISSLMSLKDDKDGEKIIKEFKKNKCIFVHVPKTGGKSIKKSLFGTCSGGHRQLRIYKILFEENKFSEYFKFAFVRNPWDRIVSAYEFLRDGGIRESDQRWSKKVLSKYENFNDFIMKWVNKKRVYKKVHFVPQYEFIRLGGVEPKVDYVGRFENFDDDFEVISKKIGKSCRIIHDNKSKRKKDYKAYYNDAAKNKVKKVYKKDIEIFDYEF